MIAALIAVLSALARWLFGVDGGSLEPGISAIT